MKPHRLLSEGESVNRARPLALEQLGAVVHMASEATSGMVSHKQIERLILIRRLRATMIGSDLFGDPAWDMLLALYAADLADKRLNASEICSAAAVPLSAARRWITALKDRGLVRTDPSDLSGTMMLSPTGSSVMNRYFSTVTTTVLPF